MTQTNDPARTTATPNPVYPPETGAGTRVAHPEHPEIHNRRDDAGSASIQHDIDRTRGQMDRTLEELGERLRPGNLLDSAVGYFAGSKTPSASQGSGRDDDAVRRAATNVASTAWEKVKGNPVPSALIGAGLAWLFLKDDRPIWEHFGGSSSSSSSSRSSSSSPSRSRGGRDEAMRRRIERNSREPETYGGSYVDARTGEPYDVEHYGPERAQGGGYREDRDYDDRSHDSRAGRAARYAGSAARSAGGYAASGASRAGRAAGGAASSAASGVGSLLHTAADKAADAAGYVAHKAGDLASSAAGAVGGAASSASHAAGDAARGGASYASDSARRARSGAGHYSRETAAAARRYGRQGYGYSRERFEYARVEHPLAVGLGALAAGVLAGLAVPRTRVEDEQFGRYSREAKDFAGDAAHEAYDRGRRVAERGVETAQGAAGREGLTVDSLKGEAGTLYEHASQAAGRVLGEVQRAAGELTEEAKRAAAHVGEDAKRAASNIAGELKDEASQVGRDAQSTAGRVGGQAKSEAQSLTDEAKQSHLNPANLADAVKHVAQETKDAVADEAEHQKDEAKREHSA